MKLKKIDIFEIEKDSNFAPRVLLLSIPPAVVFICLVEFGFLAPFDAILSYIFIILCNMVFLSPMTLELQHLKKYINRLAMGEEIENMNLSEQEAKGIAEAVNSMHRFWMAKTDALEAEAMSDAAVLDTLPDPVLMIDRSGNILGANLAARKLFDDNLTDQNIGDVFVSQHFITAAQKVLNKQSESENLIFYLEPTKQKIYAHIKSLPWFSKGRAVAVVSLYDLTKAAKIEKLQSDFVANASHELRTPLSVIAGFIETLQTTAKNDDAAREQFLAIMAEQAAFMSDLIENLLSLSKIELSQDTPPQDKTDMNKIILEVMDALQIKANARHINLIFEKPTRLKKIIADSAQMKQLMQNLIDNAVKYAVSGSDVTICLKEINEIPASKSLHVAEGKALSVSVNNKGPKIESQELSRLTERFYRLQEHKNLGIKGTGLGLAIAKQIIMRHRGNLTVSSSNKNGTTFTVYLPLKR